MPVDPALLIPPARSSVDLHLHSNVSDGRYTPRELVEILVARGLRRVALTDHDTSNGIDEALAAAAGTGLEVIPGVELSVTAGQEIHMLGLFLDYRQREYQNTLREFREGRIARARRMLDKLAALGVPVAWERAQHFAGDASFSRVHVAQAMVEAGHVASIPEAFDRYLADGKPAHEPRLHMTAEKGIEMIRGIGGCAVLAHPANLEGLSDLLRRLADAGLAGMEVYYKDYDEEEMHRLAALARERGLVPAGGSDFHGHETMEDVLPGMAPVPEGTVEALRARCP